MNTLSQLSIVIPVYNEVGNIGHLLKEIVEAFATEPFSYEIIIVNDGSNDGTGALLSDLLTQTQHLQVLTHAKNYGQSMAFITGIKVATYRTIVTLDGDGQNDPADIKRLFHLMTDEKSIIVGHRIKRHDSWLQKTSSRVGNITRNYWLKDGCPDAGCSLKIFPREAFLSLPHFNHLHRFLPSLFMRAGYKLINVPVNHRPRLYGRSKYGVMNRLFVGIYDLVGVRWLLKRTCNPRMIDAN